MTIGEIAKLAGVSTSTVSKIINNKDQSINPETRERVLQIVKEYNYTPYNTAKNNSQAKTFSIAVLQSCAENTGRMINGIVRTAQKYGYSVLLFDSQNNLQEELKHITAICQKRVDAVLWEPVSEKSEEYAHYFSELGILYSYYNCASPSPSYQIDFAAMGYALTQKLIDAKHSKIAVLMQEGDHQSALILDGYRKCLYDNQILYDNQLELFFDDEDICSKIISHKATGIISSHYSAALSLLDQFTQMHYNIPSDLSLVSLKDNFSEEGTCTNISGIQIPYLEYGSYMCEGLIRECEKKETASENKIFTPSLAFDQENSIDLPPSMRSKNILVVGSINIDTTFNVDENLQSGQTTRIMDSTVTLGGKGANQAIGASRLGCEVSLIANIGGDLDSIYAMNTLKSENLSTEGIFRDMDLQTGKAYVYVEQNGESAISIFAGANGQLSPERIRQQRHLFKNAGYCLLSTEVPLETILEAAKISHCYSIKNILNPAALDTIPEDLIPYIDIFIPNKKTAAAFCPGMSNIEEQAEYFFNLGIPIIIITLGSAGCYLRTADTSRFFPSIDVTAIDTTGGADAFISALAVYLLKSYSLETAIQIATCAASFCVTRQGVVPALIDKTSLESYIVRTFPNLLRQDN